MLPLITLEEHFISRKAREATKVGSHDVWDAFPQQIFAKLENVGDDRIRDMDKGEVSLQVLSHVPIDASSTVCRQVNDELAEQIAKSTNRLAGFALLPMAEPTEAADELSRCVKDLGFVGALLDNHLDGEFYDGERFLPVFEKAQELDVPLYLHPTFATEPMLEHYKGNYSDEVAVALSAYGWGWHVETGLHILRLFASGLFDRFPKLKIVIGHMGEMLPFQLDRCVPISERWGKRDRGLREVWKNNVWITTSGMFSLAPLACLLQTTTIDHVLYSVDYPFSATEKGKQFIDEIRASGLMKEDELERFAFRNAEELLKVKAPTL